MDTDIISHKLKAVDAFTLGYDMGVQAAKAVFAMEKGGKHEN